MIREIFWGNVIVLLYDADVLFPYPKHCIYDHNVFLKVVGLDAHKYAPIETVWRTIL